MDPTLHEAWIDSVTHKRCVQRHGGNLRGWKCGPFWLKGGIKIHLFGGGLRIEHIYIYIYILYMTHPIAYNIHMQGIPQCVCVLWGMDFVKTTSYTPKLTS